MLSLLTDRSASAVVDSVSVTLNCNDLYVYVGLCVHEIVIYASVGSIIIVGEFDSNLNVTNSCFGLNVDPCALIVNTVDSVSLSANLSGSGKSRSEVCVAVYCLGVDSDLVLPLRMQEGLLSY